MTCGARPGTAPAPAAVTGTVASVAVRPPVRAQAVRVGLAAPPAVRDVSTRDRAPTANRTSPVAPTVTGGTAPVPVSTASPEAGTGVAGSVKTGHDTPARAPFR